MMTGPVGSIVVEPKREEGWDMTGRLCFRSNIVFIKMSYFQICFILYSYDMCEQNNELKQYKSHYVNA